MEEKELRHIFAQNLKFLMMGERYTQRSFTQALNKKCGTNFSEASVSNWLHEKKTPRLIVVQKVGEFFGKDASYMLTDKGLPPILKDQIPLVLADQTEEDEGEEKKKESEKWEIHGFLFLSKSE